MYKPFIKRTLANLIVSLSTIIAFSASAVDNDVQQEILIKAKRQAADLKNKIASYIDDVEITQGSLTIQADLVQVISQDNTKVYVAKGKPAKFQQTLADGSPIILQAEEIRYEPALNTITIKGQAKVSQEGSLVSGEKMVYNIKTEQLEAEGSLEHNVTTIFKPKKNNQEPENDDSDAQ